MKLPTFAHPAMLIWGLVTALALLVLFRFLARTRTKRLTRFASPRMIGLLTASLSPGRRRTKSVLLALAVFACFAALAGPRLGTEWIEVQQRGIDILIGLDASRSMLATDLKPNRLTRAKLAIRDFISRLTGDRIGLLPFAGTTFLMCPLTTDYEAFLRSLDAVEPDLLPRQGTDLAAVINQARQILTRESNHRILVLITDGEDLGGKALAAARAAARDKVTIFTVGVGTSQGELIPDPDRAGTFLKDAEGNVVRSRLDEKSLREIAKITGGIYAPLGRMGEGLMRIYQEKLKLVPKQEHREQKKQRPIERFYWPLTVALFLFIAEFLLGERRGKGATGRAFLARLTNFRTSNNHSGVPEQQGDESRSRQARTEPGLYRNVLKLLIVCCFLAWNPDQANGLTTEQLFHQGQLDKVRQKYQENLTKDPDNPVLHYNLGDVLYRQQQYAGAAAEFSKGLKSDDLDLQARSYFNLGNSHFQMGAAAAGQPDKAEKEYRQAVKAYEASLKLNPNDQDARVNLDLAKKRLQQIQNEKKKKEKEQQEKNKQEQEKESNKKNGAQKKQSSEKNKGQQQKNAQQPDENGQDKNKQDARHDADQARERQQEQGRAQQVMPGKMSREEARALLESLRDQEGLPVYVPNGSGSRDENNLKNW